MERLTWETMDGGRFTDDENIIRDDVSGVGHFAYCGKAIDRLAAYEDTGLTPEEIVALAKARQDGRLVVLPCKVGDDLYWIDDEDKSNPVVRLQKRGVREILLGRNKLWIGDGDVLDEVGTQYCFLTRAEAEAALQNWHEDGVYAQEEANPCQEDT